MSGPAQACIFAFLVVAGFGAICGSHVPGFVRSRRRATLVLAQDVIEPELSRAKILASRDNDDRWIFGLSATVVVCVLLAIAAIVGMVVL